MQCFHRYKSMNALSTVLRYLSNHNSYINYFHLSIVKIRFFVFVKKKRISGINQKFRINQHALIEINFQSNFCAKLREFVRKILLIPNLILMIKTIINSKFYIISLKNYFTQKSGIWGKVLQCTGGKPNNTNQSVKNF